MKTLLEWLLGVVLTAGMMPALAGNPVFDPGKQGPYAVGFTYYKVTDASRGGSTGRPIPIYVWYPVDPANVAGAAPANYPMDPVADLIPAKSSEEFERYGLDAAFDGLPVSSKKPFPLVVFSPGWGGAAWHNVSMATRLASHGFVVAVLYHKGDGVWPWETQIRLENAAWHRPRDISFALTDLLNRNGKSGDVLRGAMRPDQIAAAGYSLGGYAAMVLGGAGEDNVCIPMTGWYETPPDPKFCTATAPDPRIKAIVYYDGAAFLSDWSELAQVRVPTIMIGEEWNTLGLYGWADEHARTHAAIQGKPSYRVDVSGTNHNSFCDTCEFFSLMRDDPVIYDIYANELDTDLNELVDFTCVGDEHTSVTSTVAMPLANKYAVAFLKTVFAGGQGYQDMLTPGWALKQREPTVEFFVTEKRNPNAVKEEPGFGAYYLYFPHQPGSEQARGEKDPSTKPVLKRGFTGH